MNIDLLAKKLGEHEFFTTTDLFNLGIFGTKYAARKALNDGELSYIQVSPRRRIIAKIVLLHYLKDKLSVNLMDKHL